MRQITVDFTSQTYPLFAGYLGEHNATELIAIKPADMSGEMYSLAFMTNGEVVHSKYFSANEDIKVTLWQQLTQDNTLYVQLEAYDENGDYLGKSASVKLLLSNSVHGIDMIADADNPDVYSEIAQNSAFREVLEDNADTLNKLTTSVDGNLLFDGEEIKSSGSVLDIEVKTDTEDEYVLELTTPNETITTPNLKGKQGVSGVYVGEGDMPEGYNVQIIPSIFDWIEPEQPPLAGDPNPSVNVKVEEIEGGHRVSITTASGTQSFDVLDGYTPVKGVDYFTEADKTEITNAVLDEIPEIPEKTSQLKNDSDFVTADYVTAAINGSLGEIETMIDEIETLINESGVLDDES